MTNIRLNSHQKERDLTTRAASEPVADRLVLAQGEQVERREVNLATSAAAGLPPASQEFLVEGQCGQGGRADPAGRMQPAGMADVDAAKADGSWAAAYESRRTADAPADLLAALAKSHVAAAAFETPRRSARYTTVILPLLKARSPDTRAKVLARVIAGLADQHGPIGR